MCWLILVGVACWVWICRNDLWPVPLWALVTGTFIALEWVFNLTLWQWASLSNKRIRGVRDELLLRVHQLPPVEGTQLLPKSNYDATRALTNWSLLTSGFLIGVVASRGIGGAQAALVALKVISLASFSLALVTGLMYTVVSAAAIEAEVGVHIYAEKTHYRWSVLLLNFLLWAFVSGLVALVLLLVYN